MTKLVKSFMSDEDGLSARDYMMLIFSTLFMILVVTAFIYAMMGKDATPLLQIIESMDGVVMTVVGGVFGVHAVERFRKPQQVNYQNYENHTQNP